MNIKADTTASPKDTTEEFFKNGWSGNRVIVIENPCKVPKHSFQSYANGVMRLIEMLDEEDDHIWEIASTLLVQIGRPAVEPLIEALKRESAQVRMLAADTLGQIGDARAIVPLMNLFGDRDKEVQESARMAMKHLIAAVV